MKKERIKRNGIRNERIKVKKIALHGARKTKLN